MPLTYTVEDGSGTDPTVNGYATLVQIRAYNAQRGITVPATDDDLIALAVAAVDFIETYEPRFSGARSVPLTQVLSWPRTCVKLYGMNMPNNVVPTQIINAQSYLTGVAITVDLSPVTDTRAVTKEVIGPLETDYSTAAGASLRPLIPQVDAMLAPLLRMTGSLRVVRA